MIIKLITILISITFANEKIDSLKGKTFAYAGPNCFGVALYAAGINPIIRAVDVSEFKAVLKHQCSKVKTPKPGDIGVYSVKDFDIIHAFYNYDEDTVLEKTGVDYIGKTPIHIRDKEHSYHTFGYSKECLRYGGKGNPQCYNPLDYYQCEDLDAVIPAQITAVEEKIDSILENLLSAKPRNLHEKKWS